jgi:diguanylate cyclase (GGDEF)-like protein
MAKPGSKGINNYVFIFSAIWTVGVITSLGLNIYQQKQSMLNVARTSAEISYSKDLLYRGWVSEQGGVYVPVSKKTPANPYLKVPNRDVITSEGLLLTLINPAYMTRQVNEMAMKMHTFQGHITSLNPLRPKNNADPWETDSLKKFAAGTKETTAIEMVSEKEYFRFMRPFVTEKSCLKCHAIQGHKEGDIRGGISISIPMEPLRAIERSQIANLTLAYGLLWIMGLIGIGIGALSLRKQMLQREKAEEEIRILSITDTLTGLYNRRGFLTLAEQQFKVSDRARNKLILFTADLDGLKWINDTLGHAEGDTALIEAASVFKKTFRSSDIIARIGGDEFVILSIAPEEIKLDNIFNRLQNQIDTHNHESNRKYKLSISIGYSLYDPKNPSSINELMVSADKLMYEQKKNKNFRPV